MSMTFKPEVATIAEQVRNLTEKVEQLTTVRPADKSLQQGRDVLKACCDAIDKIYADVTLKKENVVGSEANASIDQSPNRSTRL